MATKGMDVEQVRNFGNQLKNQFAEQVRTMKSNVTNQAQSLNWQGDDANQFKGDRLGSITQAMDVLIAKLDEVGQVALNNADAQDSTSAQI